MEQNKNISIYNNSSPAIERQFSCLRCYFILHLANYGIIKIRQNILTYYCLMLGSCNLLI